MEHLRNMAGLAALVLSVTASHAAPLDEVGLRNLSARSPARQMATDITVFYPARNDGFAETYGGSGIFVGVDVRRDASAAEGRFPVVLLAIGGLRANPAISNWLASYLAARGNIVVAPHPPRLTDAQAAVAEVWLRPSDLSSALSAVGTMRSFHPIFRRGKSPRSDSSWAGPPR